MAEIFTLEQLASFMQTDLDEASAELARTMATSLIRAAVGADRYDALTDLSPLLPVALMIARRLMLNPEGIQQESEQESIDDYSHSTSRMYPQGAATGSLLTPSEVAQIRQALGIRSAFTVTPYVPPPPCPPPTCPPVVWRP